LSSACWQSFTWLRDPTGHLTAIAICICSRRRPFKRRADRSPIAQQAVAQKKTPPGTGVLGGVDLRDIFQVMEKSVGERHLIPMLAGALVQRGHSSK
jgi:hypothetical protein